MPEKLISELIGYGITGGGGIGATLLGLYVLDRSGILKVKRPNGHDNGAKPGLPCAMHETLLSSVEKVVEKMYSRDEKNQEILQELNVTQRMTTERINQINDGMKQGRGHFGKLFDGIQKNGTDIKLLDQRVDRLEES